MQSAESVLGKMILLKDKLAKGEQLTAKQRQEMRVIAEQMLEVSRKSFSDDPIVKARQKELELK